MYSLSTFQKDVSEVHPQEIHIEINNIRIKLVTNSYSRALKYPRRY
jgi:hypothetical protein